MPTPGPEHIAKVMLTPDKLAIGTGYPPVERFIRQAQQKQFTKESLKQLLKEGEATKLDQTPAHVQDLKGKISSIGKDIDENTGEWKRPGSSTEEIQYKQATSGLEMGNKLIKYETLAPTEQKILQQEVVKLLEELPGGKEYIAALPQKERMEAADRFIRQNRQRIAERFQARAEEACENSELDASTKAKEMFDKNEAYQIKRTELDIERTKLSSYQERQKRLQNTKKEFDAPGDTSTGEPNKGKQLQQLEAKEPDMLQSISTIQSRIETRKFEAEKLADAVKRTEAEYNKTKNSTTKSSLDEAIKKYAEKLDEITDLEIELNKVQSAKDELAALRNERDSLPKSLDDAQEAIDRQVIEIRKRELEQKNAANELRLSKLAKERVDELLATTTGNLWKNVIRDVAHQRMEETIDLYMAPEVQDAFQAEMLSLLDQKTETDWTQTKRRMRMGTYFQDYLGPIQGPKVIDVRTPNYAKIDNDFNQALADNTGSIVKTRVEGLIGTANWNQLSAQQQQELEAAYIVKLVHRRVDTLKMNLTNEEARSLRSGPYADALIRQGLMKNQDFKDELLAEKNSNLTAEELKQPTPETIQKVKAAIGKEKILTTLMLGLAPLALFKTQEQHA